jgi:hypothetical protein
LRSLDREGPLSSFVAHHKKQAFEKPVCRSSQETGISKAFCPHQKKQCFTKKVIEMRL